MGCMGWAREQHIFQNWKPWVAIVLATKKGSCCQGCFKPGCSPDPDIKCPDCGLVDYCSWSCRARDDLHHFECKVLAEAGTIPLRDETRVMIRTIGKLLQTGGDKDCLVKGGGDGDAVPTRDGLRRFSDMLSHKQDFFKSTEKTENVKIVYDEVEEFLLDDMPSLDQFMEVLGRLYINGFEICDRQMESYGWGVYLGPSILDHSCQPNCMVSFHGNSLTVTAASPISLLEEAFISYLNPSLPANIRQSKLYNNYFFKCICSKCVHSHRGRDVDISPGDTATLLPAGGAKRDKERRKRPRGRR